MLAYSTVRGSGSAVPACHGLQGCVVIAIGPASASPISLSNSTLWMYRNTPSCRGANEVSSFLFRRHFRLPSHWFRRSRISQPNMIPPTATNMLWLYFKALSSPKL
ncbi:hypothetical protein N431DRAFT_68434 [Stipitochalara longipes BDJ]|nr:hypothetical protein N431DRAFT_68434 [Stipitochalara longipes BDJ]